MSKRSTLWKRKLRQVAGDMGRFERALPRATVVGRGTRLAHTDTNYSQAPHGERGAGTVCSLPMGSEKAARVLALRKGL